MNPRTCSIDNCDQRHHARGWCSGHYKRWKAYGDPIAEVVRLDPPTERRMEAARRRREERFEDARDMISWRVHPEEIARRLGVTVEGLERQAQRWGAHDIAVYMQRVEVAA